MATFRARQGNATVASAVGPAAEAEAEIWHYAMQYREDGPVTIQRREPSPAGGGKWCWKRHALLEQWPAPVREDDA